MSRVIAAIDIPASSVTVAMGIRGTIDPLVVVRWSKPLIGPLRVADVPRNGLSRAVVAALLHPSLQGRDGCRTRVERHRRSLRHRVGVHRQHSDLGTELPFDDGLLTRVAQPTCVQHDGALRRRGVGRGLMDVGVVVVVHGCAHGLVTFLVNVLSCFASNHTRYVPLRLVSVRIGDRLLQRGCRRGAVAADRRADHKRREREYRREHDQGDRRCPPVPEATLEAQQEWHGDSEPHQPE